MADLRVVWDGRRDGPGGRLLFAPKHDPQPVAVVPSHVCPRCGGPKALRAAIYCRQCYKVMGRRSSKP